MVRVPFVVVGPGDQVPVVPLAGADLDAEGQAIFIKPGWKANRRHAQHVDPARVAVRPVTETAILRHGLVDGRHLARGIDEAVEVQAIELLLIESQYLPARGEKLFFGLRISFKRGLFNVGSSECPRFSPADDDGRQRFPDCVLVFSGVVLGRSKVREKLVGALADVRQGADVGGSVDRSARLRPRREVRRLHAGRRLVSPVSTEWSILDCLFKLFRRGVGTPPLEDGRFSVENKGGYGESFAFEVPVYRPVNSSAFWHVPNNHRIASRRFC